MTIMAKRLGIAATVAFALAATSVALAGSLPRAGSGTIQIGSVDGQTMAAAVA
jgi:hypothetical protein